jgi:ribosome-binding factor A
VLRREVGRGITLRLTPSLEFVLDALPQGAAHLEGLLAEVAERDAAVAAHAAGKRFAGEADPYRKPADDLDDEPEA